MRIWALFGFWERGLGGGRMGAKGWGRWSWFHCALFGVNWRQVWVDFFRGLAAASPRQQVSRVAGLVGCEAEAEPGEDRQRGHEEEGDGGGGGEDVGGLPGFAGGVEDDGRGHGLEREQEVAEGTDEVEEDGGLPESLAEVVAGWGGDGVAGEREGLVEEVGGEVPAEEVGDGDAVKGAAIGPDPGAVERGPVGFHGEVPSEHEEGCEQGGGDEACVAEGLCAEDEQAEDPGAVADAEVGEDEQDGELEELWAHDGGEVVVAERESGAEA